MPEGDSHPVGRSTRRKWLAVAAVLAVVAVGALLRFHAIGRKSLWLDEAATMGAVDASFAEVFRGVKAFDAHPPLYYLALRAWTQRSQDGAWARAFSAAVSVATLVAFYFLARTLVSHAAALVASLVLAASAYQVYFAQEARLYALAAFFVVLSWAFFAQLVGGKWRHAWPWFLGLALANTAGLYTFYFTAFSIAAQLVALLLLWRGVGRRLVIRWVLWQMVPAALFTLWVPVILERMKMLGQFAPPAGATVLSANGLLETASQFSCGFLSQLAGPEGPAVRAAAAAGGLLVLVLALVGFRRERAAAVAALAWLIAPVVFLAALPLRGHAYEPKHLIFASPALALAAGVAFAGARGKLKALTVALLVAMVVANVVSLARYYRPGVEKENWRDAWREFARQVAPGDIVTFTPPYVEIAFDFYERGSGHPLWRVRSPVVGEPFRAGELARGRRVWVFQGASNVEKPNPLVVEALQGYPRLFEWSHEGLVGTVSVGLYDTFKPSGAGAEGPRRR